MRKQKWKLARLVGRAEHLACGCPAYLDKDDVVTLKYNLSAIAKREQQLRLRASTQNLE